MLLEGMLMEVWVWAHAWVLSLLLLGVGVVVVGVVGMVVMGGEVEGGDRCG